ncbi:type I-E CRISPR-associated endoribonuclease Cas2e [Pseudoclavibacter chungangensis]|uniref:type I-E CRISPR-associated endoribonuclease Cas2e n=1 Tax=Pseudoclavibacter chungangensis TaxID=587635 RepID=UPI001CE3C035|nr:type I-E CRISPR-associated endoribonuclease Cas2e [Pseudoclavibacter chungangensis]
MLAACPAGLRGQLTRWLMEIAPGVFVGRVSRRVRELLWARVVELSRDGRAIMVFSARNEQRLDFLVHRSEWVPVERDGLQLILRPSLDGPKRAVGRGVVAGGVEGDAAASSANSVDENPRRGWSRASQRRIAARRRGGRRAEDS